MTKLREHGHDVDAPPPKTGGLNTITGEGLPDALFGQEVVVDVSNSPSFEDAAAMEFFETSTRNLLAAEKQAGVGHHVVLSVVGTARLPDSGYFRAKFEQEQLIRDLSAAYSIVHATQFFEFVKSIAAAATNGDRVRLSPARIQPIAADDVAAAVARVAVGAPLNGVVEVAGPDQYGLVELVRRGLKARNDPREVITDSDARYFGALLGERTLLPSQGARLAETHFEEWLVAPAGVA